MPTTSSCSGEHYQIVTAIMVTASDNSPDESWWLLQAERLFTFADHLGTVAVNGCGAQTQYLDVANWGSRIIYRSAVNGLSVQYFAAVVTKQRRGSWGR